MFFFGIIEGHYSRVSEDSFLLRIAVTLRKIFVHVTEYMKFSINFPVTLQSSEVKA